MKPTLQDCTITQLSGQYIQEPEAQSTEIQH